jgi:anti-sigma regulatory factor (Ser/Thr protein kinase)
VLSAAYAFPCEAHSVGGARRCVAEALSTWRLPSNVIEIAVLLVSELATNAVVHARAPFDVLVTLNAPRVRVAVADDSAQPPTPRPQPAPLGGNGGRGLHLVEALSQDWGTEQVPDDGKVVWFELSV